MRRERSEAGLTMVEMMVAVLIMGVLLGAAAPTYLRTRSGASDRAAQTIVRTALSASAAVYSEEQKFLSDSTVLRLAEPSLEWVNQLPSVLPGTTRVYVRTEALGDAVILAARSGEGDCFWIRRVASSGTDQFARNGCGGEPSSSDWAEAWA